MREGVVAQDLAGDGLAVDVRQNHERRSDRRIGGATGEQLGNANASGVGRAKNVRFHSHVADVARTLPLQDETASTRGETPGLARRPSGQPRQILDPVPHDLGEAIGQRIAGGVAHPPSLRTSQQAARTDAYGLTGRPRLGRISKCRCGVP